MNPYFPGHVLDSMNGPLGALRGMQSSGPLNRLAALGGLFHGGQPGGAMGIPGVSVAAMPQQHPLAVAAQNAAAAGAGASLANLVELARGDDVVYGVDSGSANIAASASATISVQPQKRHIPTRLVLSENMANNFVITAISTGVEPILITTGALSAAIFIQDSTCPNFRSVVCEVGNTFNITVTNITLATQRFTATVVGKYLPNF